MGSTQSYHIILLYDHLLWDLMTDRPSSPTLLKLRSLVVAGDANVGQLMNAVEHECAEEELVKNKYSQIDAFKSCTNWMFSGVLVR